MLGQLVWFAVGGVVEYDGDYTRQVNPLKTRYSDVEKWFEELKLDCAFLPARIREVDSFRKATGELSIELPIPDKPDHVVQFFTDGETTDDDRVMRTVMREVRQGRVRMSSTKVAELIFFRGTPAGRGRLPGSATFTYRVGRSVPRHEAEPLVQALEQAKAEYADSSTHLAAQAIRSVVRTYLLSLMAVQMHSSGGLYFVAAEHRGTVLALQELVRRVGGGATFGEIEVPDSADRRRMVNEAVQVGVGINARELLREMTTTLKKPGAISYRTYTEFVSRYNDVRDMSAYYAELLALPQDDAAEILETALESLSTVQTRLGARQR